jgi:hypothetical protein
MANKQGLHVNKEELLNLIYEYVGDNDCVIDDVVINPVNNAHRISIKKDIFVFCIDVFYRMDNTISLKEYCADGNGEESKLLVAYIKENCTYKDIPHGEFSTIINNEHMDLLIEYLSLLEGVTLINKINNGTNGMIYKFSSDIGDNITLTYYNTTCRMKFQGVFLKLSAEVKCFLSPISTIQGQKSSLAISGHQMMIDNLINKFLPQAYANLNILQQNLIHDSVSQLVCRPITKEYSVWVFSILKGLEARIKEIFQRNSIVIYDKLGFKMYNNITSSYAPIFNKTGQNYHIDSSITSITDGNTVAVLDDCYDFFAKNRNCLFHTKQIGASRILATSSEAESIIYNVMKLFEESYIKLSY